MVSFCSLRDRTIVVTGASSGIGRATAVRLSSLGARVVLVGRDESRLAETLSLLSGDGHGSIAFNLLAVDDIPQLLSQTARDYGVLHGVAHCAGVQSFSPLKAARWQAALPMMNLNVGAAFALAKGFRQQGVCSSSGGSLVFVSSVAGLQGQSGIAAYSASKSALIGLAQSLAAELARERIRVNCVAPGVVDTPMWEATRSRLTGDQAAAIVEGHPLGLGEPGDVANAIAFLLSDEARWITGIALPVDGGYLLG